MIYYKDDANGEVYAYYHADLAEGLIREGLRAMTAEEVLAHLNPVAVYWTDGTTLVHAKYGADGWWQASEE
ncbi:MAG: hypothetical protein RSE94_22495, partial [Pseudomonas sp.]